MSAVNRLPSGFTLVELIVVMAVAGILAAVAMPAYSSFIRSQQAKTASFELFAAFTLARSEAIKRNDNVTLTPSDTANWGKGWTIASPGGPIKSQAALKGVFISATGAPASVEYARNGRVAGATAPSFLIDVAATATANVRCIKIELSGMPRTVKGAC